MIVHPGCTYIFQVYGEDFIVMHNWKISPVPEDERYPRIATKAMIQFKDFENLEKSNDKSIESLNDSNMCIIDALIHSY
jgi:hypothetical protein